MGPMKFDYNKQLITVSMIPLSGFHFKQKKGPDHKNNLQQFLDKAYPGLDFIYFLL